MRHQGRRPRARPIRILLPLLAALVSAFLAALVAPRPATARELAVRGMPGAGFGRVELAFDQATKVKVRASGAVLVLGFSDSARIKPDRLANELPAYIGAARRDPDGTGLRLALTQPFRVSVLEAGERVFVDLLPPTWVGLPPGLPAEVVAELAERARRAEARLREEEARRAENRKPLRLRLARLPGRTRIVLEPPAGTPVRTAEVPGGLDAVFDGRLVLDDGGSRPKAEPGVADFSVREDGQGLAVRVRAAPGFGVRSFPEDGSLVVDVLVPGATAAADPLPAPPAAPVKAEGPRAAPPPVVPTHPAPAPAAARAGGSDPVPAPVPPPSRPEGAGPVRPLLRAGEGGASLVLPFRQPTGAAAFVRGGVLTAVFHASDGLDDGGLSPADRDAVGLQSLRREGDFTVLALRFDENRPTRLLPEGGGWALVRGRAETAAVPPDDVVVTRSGDADGLGEIRIGLSAGTAVHWLTSPDEVPLAVVTSAGRQAMSAERRLLEFTVLPTIQGVVVQPSVDGVRVRLGRGGVTVSRPGGLALSAVGRGGEGPSRFALAISAEAWHRDGAGDVLSTLRDRTTAASEAAKAGRAEARIALARVMLANGLSHEAGSLLALAAQEDGPAARRRDLLVLSAVAAVRARRFRDARTMLSDDALSDDPEAQLWRVALDVDARDWPKVLAGIRRADPVLSLYPDELAGEFRLAAVRAAAETGDGPAAEAALAVAEQLPPGAVDHGRMELHRAIVDATAGRTLLAMRAFERLAEDAPRPIAAEATLRAVLLGRRSGRLPAEEAVTRLEALALGWRGDAVELGALAELATLYGEGARWRDMLNTARLVDARFPGEALARQVHAETARRFESLFLGHDTAKSDAVEVLALYYDFREFAPVGRRGDEIVRRIADRLVEIELLDQAASLLQHQVDNRLSGTARTVIATRLAALRLMSGRAALALDALRGSRMAELPAPLRRLRLLIEAQALADTGRTDLALEIVDAEDGADFTRLRATILFAARRWREAGEAYEGLLGLRWRDGDALTPEERGDVLRAALADALAGEWLALGRLRGKFAGRMADSPDAKTFEALGRPRAVETPEFRTALREASRAAPLRRFLGDWSRIADLPPSEPDVVGAHGDGRPGPG